jgi:hypothetical protein
MPSINKSFLDLLKSPLTNYPIFIETGTFQGATTFAMESLFEKVYTVELSEKYHTLTKNKYNGNKIDFILGDSSKVFETLLPSITNNAIFFLDGHWSSGDTGKGSKDCPLMEEITHINNLFKHEAILIIDDYRLFGRCKKTRLVQDWSDINKDAIINILKNRITNIYHLPSNLAIDDRLILHINSGV